ncbi:trichohyalin-like isoform X2 [Branchiostoma lanceolatum]|uniref:trichohyalin-like isoform X2 n=1 Tax=Branchiostoma lanceolatum TaxID=7740 RepID=UPI0034517F26
MSNLNLSLLSRGIGQVSGNGQEKVDVFLEPEDYYNMFPQFKVRHKHRKRKWKASKHKTSHSYPLGSLDMDYFNIPSEEPRNQFFLPPIESRQLSRGTHHTKSVRGATTAHTERVSSPLNLPHTFSTRKGPLLLYSEDLAHKTHEGKVEKRKRRARQFRRLSETEESFQLKNISDLSKAILQYGKATNSNEELYLKFMHHRQKDLWARKVRPGFSAKRYISNWSRLWDDSMLNKLKSSGRVSDKTLYRENPFGHSLNTKRRYENLSYIPPPYRLNRNMMQSPGNFGNYEFYRVKPDMIDSGRGTPDSAMEVDQESVVGPVSPPHHPSPFGQIKTVVHEDGALKELPYNELRLGEKHEVLTELLATAYAHQLSSREGEEQEAMFEEKDDESTTQVDMRRAIESLVTSTKPPSRPAPTFPHYQRRASVLTLDIPETERAEGNPSHAKYYTGMLKGSGLTSETTVRRASIASTQPGRETWHSIPSLSTRDHSRATPSRQYSSTTFEGTLPPILPPIAKDRLAKQSDTGYHTDVLQGDVAEVQSEISSVPNLPPIKVGIKRGSLDIRSTREVSDKAPEKLPTITMEPPTPLHHLGGGTPQKGTPLQERPEIRATMATTGFEPWQSTTDESLDDDEHGWVQMDEEEILRRAEEEEKMAAAVEKQSERQSEKQSSKRSKSSARSSLSSKIGEVVEEEPEEEEEQEDEEDEIDVEEEDDEEYEEEEEEEMEERMEERMSVVVTPKPKSIPQGKETPASKASSSGKKVEKFVIGKVPTPKRERVEKIEAPPPTAEDTVPPKKEAKKTLPPKGGGITPRGAEQKTAAPKPKPQKQPSQASLGENLANLAAESVGDGRKRRGSGSVAGVSVSGSEKSNRSLVVKSIGDGSGGGDAASVKSSQESLSAPPSHVHQSMRGSQRSSRAAKFSGRSDKKKDVGSETSSQRGSQRGSIIVAPGGEVVSVGGSVKAASDSGRSQQPEEEREDDRMSEDSGHMSEGEEEPAEIRSVASGPSLGSQRASKIYGYSKRQEIDVTGGDFDASAFLSARSVKSDDSKSQKSEEDKESRSQKGSVKSSVSNPNLASNAPSLAPIEDEGEEDEEEEEEDWPAMAKEGSDRESQGSLAASQKSLREHAAAIAAAVLQKQGTGRDLGTDALVAARLWREVDDMVRLEDLPPRARSADPQPKQRGKEMVHDGEGNEIEVDVLGPLPEAGQLSQKMSRSAGPLVAIAREMRKQAALLGMEGQDFEVDADTLQQLQNESLTPEDIEIVRDEATGKNIIRSRRSSKASELSSKPSIAATSAVSAAPKAAKPAPKPAAKPREPLKPDVTNYGKADAPEKEEKEEARVPPVPVTDTKKDVKPPPKKEEAPKKVETPKKAEPPKKVETPKPAKEKKEKVVAKEEPAPKKEEVKEEKTAAKEKESPAKAEKAPKEKESKKKKKAKSPVKEVAKEEPEPPKEETPEPPSEKPAKSAKGSAKSGKSTKSHSSLEDRPTFVIGQPKTEVKAEEPLPVLPKKEAVPKAAKAPAAKKGGKKKGKKEKEKKPEEQAAPEEEAPAPEEEIVRSPTPEPEEPEPEPESEPEPEPEEEEETPSESPTKASVPSATPSRASPEKTATPALVQPLPFSTVNAPPSTKSEGTESAEGDHGVDEEAAEAAKAAAREKRAQREAARAAAAQKRKEEVERKRKEREDQKRREQEEIERQERMKQELADERMRRDEEHKRRKEQMEEEKKKQADEEEKRRQAEIARLERERRQQDEYRRMMAEMQRKKKEEEQRKAEIAAEKAREEEERRLEEEEKMAQMEEAERLEYERQKREEEEKRRAEEEERRLREEEEARIRMEEARLLAERMAKERALLEEKLKFQRGLASESSNLEHGHNLNPAFTFSYYELLQLLGLQFPTEEGDKDVNG